MIRLLYFCVSLFLWVGCTNQTSEKAPLMIATAANMQYAMEELTERFHKTHDIECQLVVSSSGKLTAQIKEGAPYDVFVSADMDYPKVIEENGLAIEPSKVYAYGKLVLWSMLEKPELDSLYKAKFKHIAVANPSTAPYGKNAFIALINHGDYEVVQRRFVHGESISQTNQFIISGAAEVGFTAKSVVLSPKLKNKGYWTEVDQALYNPIEQAIVAIKQEGKDSSDALKFVNFMSSEEAKLVLIKYGYSIDE